MPSVKVEGETQLDQLHWERMEDAKAQMLFELMRKGGERANRILGKYEIAILPSAKGPIVGINYPEGVSQINEVELAEEKLRLSLANELAEKAAKKGLRKRKRGSRK